jgi:uncharacterized protein (DUF1697 family)
MADLVACFDRMGFADVATYIQSGNILFRAGEQDEAGLTAGSKESCRTRSTTIPGQSSSRTSI